MPALVRMLKDSKNMVVVAALDALATYGEAAAAAMPAVRKLTQGSKIVVRSAAERALKAIESAAPRTPSGAAP